MRPSRKAAVATAGLAALLLGYTATATQAGTFSAVNPAPAAKVDIASTPSAPSTVTPVTMAPIGDPRVVSGSDGMQHIDYDLLVTNVYAYPVTLTSVTVRGDGGASVFTIQGAALADVTESNFSQAKVVPPAQVPVSGQVAVEVDVKLPIGAKLPRKLDHVMGWSVTTSAPFIDGKTTGQISGLPLTVSRIKPEVLDAPLKGAGWMSLNGCCAPNAHRSLRYAINGSHEIKAEMFAVDWVQLTDGAFFTGDGSSNADYPYLGTDVLAVANATVVKTRDGMPNEQPFAQPAKYVKTGQDYVGNSVVLKIGPDRYAIYAHLQPGSVKVKVGDRVRTGDVLAKLGNSGNTTAAHLHFVVTDGPDFLTATSLPFVIDQWTLQGNAVIPAGPGIIPVTGPPAPQTRTHPLVLSVADFGSDDRSLSRTGTPSQ